MTRHPARNHFILALSGLLAVFTFVGCGDAPTDEQEKTPETLLDGKNDGRVDENKKNPRRRFDEHGPVDPVELAPREPYLAGETPETERTGEDWPQFLGLNATSVSGETGLLDKWPEDGPPVLWKMRIGSGYAAPSIMGNRLILFHRQGDEDAIECYTADTKEWLWRQPYPTDFVDPYGYSNGPRCSPLVTKDRVYAFSSNGLLVCLDLETGDEIWKRDTAADFKIPPAFFGVGSTPVLEGNLLIAMVGGHPRSGIVAFNAHTGETVWENVGLEDWEFPNARHTKDPKLASYSSLVVREINGRRHLLALMRPGLVSLDPQTGEINFSYYYRAFVKESVNAAMPIVVDDQIFLSAAYKVGSVLLRVSEDGKSVEEVWKNPDAMQTHWTTAIYKDGHLYGFSGRNEVPSDMRCIELATGDVKWKTEEDASGALANPRDGSSSVEPKWYGRGSAVLAEDKFIVLGERGTLALVSSDPEKFEEISRVKYPEMRYPSWTGPVLSRQRLYIRCEDNSVNRECYLLCLDLAKSDDK